MKIALAITIFLLLGAFFLISNHSLALSKEGNFDKLKTMYSAWIGQLFSNALDVTGYVVKFDWLPSQKISA